MALRCVRCEGDLPIHRLHPTHVDGSGRLMSLPKEEARALDAAFQFLCDLSSGAEKRIPSETRKRARQVLRHYPLAAGMVWLTTAAGQPKATARPPHPDTMAGK